MRVPSGAHSGVPKRNCGSAGVRRRHEELGRGAPGGGHGEQLLREAVVRARVVGQVRREEDLVAARLPREAVLEVDPIDAGVGVDVRRHAGGERDHVDRMIEVAEVTGQRGERAPVRGPGEIADRLRQGRHCLVAAVGRPDLHDVAESDAGDPAAVRRERHRRRAGDLDLVLRPVGVDEVVAQQQWPVRHRQRTSGGPRLRWREGNGQGRPQEECDCNGNGCRPHGHSARSWDWTRRPRSSALPRSLGPQDRAGK